MYSRLGERLGITDHSMVLNLIVNKIAANLRLYGSCDEIIQATLTLFQVRQACEHVCRNPAGASLTAHIFG